MLRLENAYSQFNTERYGTLFYDLFNIFNCSTQVHKSDATDSYYFKLLRDRCNVEEPRFENGVQQDTDEALLLFMNAAKSIAHRTNQIDHYLKTFYITCSITTDDGPPTLEHQHAIPIVNTNFTLKQLVDQHFVGTVTEYTDEGRTIRRTYQSLPDQLVFTCDRKRNGNAVYYTYPVEFATNDGLRYQVTGVIMHSGNSLDAGHFVTLVRRQDYVYILDDQHVVGGFHIDYLTSHLENVI